MAASVTSSGGGGWAYTSRRDSFQDTQIAIAMVAAPMSAAIKEHAAHAEQDFQPRCRWEVNSQSVINVP